MADKIEILENTITKLLIRRGTNSDRLNVTLNLGEPGFTTDTQRLFIGDGATPGGILAGNKYLGEVTNPTNITTALTGDLCYATRVGAVPYFTTFIKTTNNSELSSWTPVVPVASTPKAWVCFDGYSTTFPATAVITSSHNINKVENPSRGEYKIFFTYAFPNSGYAVSFGGAGPGSDLNIKTDNGRSDGPVYTTKLVDTCTIVNTTSSCLLSSTYNASVFFYTS